MVDEPERIKDEEEFKGWDTGYRAWKLKFLEGQPRLGSLTREDVWEPGERGVVESDWEGEEKEPFEKTTKGLYFLKTLKDVKSRYSGEDVYGAVTPFGTYEEGPVGFRAAKAKVRAIFRGAVPCYVCRRSAKYFIHDSERFAVCEAHFKKVEKLVREHHFTEEEVEEVLRRLAEIYDAELAEAPTEEE